MSIVQSILLTTARAFFMPYGEMPTRPLVPALQLTDTVIYVRAWQRCSKPMASAASATQCECDHAWQMRA